MLFSDRHKVNAQNYISLLEPWIKSSMRHIVRHPDRPDLAIYGTGYNSWGVQTQQKAFAAFAVVATHPEYSKERTGMTQADLIELTLALLRFNLESHWVGTISCMDMTSWGHTWISVLGLERMMHGVAALDAYLTDHDRALLRAVLISESNWLLECYPIEAGPVKNNKPESNFWNGAMLHRTAAMYPDAPNAAGYREKGSRFMVNAISIPEDAFSADILDGKTVAEQHVGYNFFESYALNHHGYMNLGYMVIVLSNIAMLYFLYREKGLKPPEVLFHHVRSLWDLVKHLTCSDGRLLRIGGDTRVRYCYCQDYAIPMWLMMADWLDDRDAIRFESGWLEHVHREVAHNNDGLFLSDRCGAIESLSPLYYTRLESDRACSLSMGAYWRRMVAIPEAVLDDQLKYRTGSWHDVYHGSCLHQSARRFVSWTWLAAQRPQGLCLPPEQSDLAEWRTNLAGQIAGSGRKTWQEIVNHNENMFDGGFLTYGQTAVYTEGFLAEGQAKEHNAESRIVFAALPDDRTVLVMQHIRSTMRSYLTAVKGLFLQIPNDIFNKRMPDSRVYWTADGRVTVLRQKDHDFMQAYGGNWINVEQQLGVAIAYSRDSLTLHSPTERQIGIMDGKPGMLLADEICTTCRTGGFFVNPGELLVDNGFVLLSGSDEIETKDFASNLIWQPKAFEPEARVLAAAGADGKTYLLVALVEPKNGMITLSDVPPGNYRSLTGDQTYEVKKDGHLSVILIGSRAMLLQSV